MFKTFEEFLIEANEPQGNYVAIGGDLDSSGVELESGKFTKEPHVTLMYSENTSIPFDAVNSVLEKHGQITATFNSTQLFEERGLDTVALVLTLDAPELHAIHEELQEIGLEHSFKDYHPHMTFAYRMEKSHGEALKSKLDEMFKGKEFPLSGWTNKKINKNWADE